VLQRAPWRQKTFNAEPKPQLAGSYSGSNEIESSETETEVGKEKVDLVTSSNMIPNNFDFVEAAEMMPEDWSSKEVSPDAVGIAGTYGQILQPHHAVISGGYIFVGPPMMGMVPVPGVMPTPSPLPAPYQQYHEDAAASFTGAPVRRRFCPHCGQGVEPHFSFCTRCGFEQPRGRKQHRWAAAPTAY
jgi:hypothetical protein